MNFSKLDPTKVKSVKDLTNFVFHEFDINGEHGVSIPFMSVIEEKESLARIKQDSTLMDWDYYINQYGFRGKWELNSLPKIGVYGCSCTFGVGTDWPYIYSSRLQDYYGRNKVEVLNFGLPGSSIQRIAKIVSATLRLFDIKIAIITLPSETRALLLNEKFQFIDLVPNYFYGFIKEKAEKLYQVYDDNNLSMLALDYINWIRAELTAKGSKMFFTSWNSHTYFEILYPAIPKNQLLPVWDYWPYKSFGRDGSHPGIDAHKKFYEMIIKGIPNV